MGQNIQWFPGHMAKARREVEEKLRYIDVVFELIDARIPISSRNPMMDKIVKDKPRIILLNKADLADESATRLWQTYFEKQEIPTLAINALSTKSMPMLLKTATALMSDKLARQKAKGLKQQTIRAMCIGIPNVGKSTLMNRLVNKKIAKTGNRPGVTTGQQWLKTGSGLEFLDTPGILWPKFEDPIIGKKLALTGAIKDNLLAMDDLALFGLEFFQKEYPKQLQKRYNLTDEEIKLMPVDLLLVITKKRGFLDDYDRASEMIVREIRDGKLGRFTLDNYAEFIRINEENHE